MLTNAIKEVEKFTRPIHTISKNFAGNVNPVTSTLFFVNEDAVAITCKHVLDLIVQADPINLHYRNFLAEKKALPKNGRYKSLLAALVKKYNYKNDITEQLKNQFVNCVDTISNINCHTHPTLDLAIIEFQGFTKTLYTSYATFVKDPTKIQPGKYVCKLGFPFPEFNNFQENPTTEEIEFTNAGNMTSPQFPLDGIITRFIGSAGNITAIETSTPGLKGQSGGPLFDSDGLIYGMQYATNHLHLGFDIKNFDIVNNGKKEKISNHPFLNVGHCIHVDQIKDFLKLHKIKFYEEV